ncbi:MAG: guanylate kinase [Acidobacteria bacterium]|nr:MAG: guanylate kinase [Acidobacteriota bacterium]
MSNRKHFLIVISSPSGAGKTTLVSALLDRVPQTRLSVSYTTRPPRPHEVDGRDYTFISRDEFDRMRQRGEFLEWAEVHGNLYGTSRRMIEEILSAGCDAVLDIDVQGAAQVRKQFPDAVTVFILPPSFTELKRRLSSRGTETPESLERRLRVARREVLRYTEFEYLVINDQLDVAIAAVEAIVRAERQKRQRREDEARAILRTFDEQPAAGRT